MNAKHAATIKHLKARAARHRSNRWVGVDTAEEDYSEDRNWADKHLKRGRLSGVTDRYRIAGRVPLQERDGSDAYAATNPSEPVSPEAPEEYSTATVWIVGGLAAVGGGYLVGRLWKAHRQSQAAKAKLTAVHGDLGDVRTADLRGLDVLVSLS